MPEFLCFKSFSMFPKILQNNHVEHYFDYDQLFSLQQMWTSLISLSIYVLWWNRSLCKIFVYKTFQKTIDEYCVYWLLEFATISSHAYTVWIPKSVFFVKPRKYNQKLCLIWNSTDKYFSRLPYLLISFVWKKSFANFFCDTIRCQCIHLNWKHKQPTSEISEYSSTIKNSEEIASSLLRSSETVQVDRTIQYKPSTDSAGFLLFDTSVLIWNMAMRQ